MDVSDISSYLYNSVINGTNTQAVSSVSSVSKTGSVSSQNDLDSTELSSFASALDTEVSKVSQLTELAAVLDDTALGSMVSEADESSLSALAEDMLGTGGGREVLSKMIDGHFQSMVLTDDSDDDDDSDISDELDSYSQTVSDTQTLLDNLNSIIENLGTSETSES